MRGNTFFAVSLTLAVVLVQAGCNRFGEPRPDSVAAAALPPASTAAAPLAMAPPNTNSPFEGGSGVAAPAKALLSSVTLPAGTTIAVRTTTALSTKSQQAGQSFTAYLSQPLSVDGREVAPKGAAVEGRVVSASQGGRVKGRASLAVQLTRLRTNSGPVGIRTSSVSRVARATKGRDAMKIGIGSGIGAAIGAIAGGGVGAGIGAAAGGGAGTGVVLATRGAPAVIPSESVLQFALRSPVTVPVPR